LVQPVAKKKKTSNNILFELSRLACVCVLVVDKIKLHCWKSQQNGDRDNKNKRDSAGKRMQTCVCYALAVEHLNI